MSREFYAYKMRLFLKKRRKLKITVGFLILAVSGALIFWQHKSLFPVQPWPKNKTLTYYNGSDYNRSLEEAFRQWERERTGIPIHFKEIFNKKEADLLIEDSTQALKESCNKPETCVGWASYIGYSAYPFGSEQTQIILTEADAKEEKETLDFYQTTIIIHELGHVLGLEHGDKDCSVMAENRITCSSNSEIIMKKFKNKYRLYYDCGPWKKDIDSLEELYDIELRVPGRCYDKEPRFLKENRFGSTTPRAFRPQPFEEKSLKK